MEIATSRDEPPTTPDGHGASCTCRAHPLPAEMTVREARDVYVTENGFTMAA
jgi:hypothetical protein